MISNTSKIALGIFALLLLVVFFAPPSLGFVVLIEGILALIASLFLANDIKKLDNSLRSKSLSVVLVSTLLYVVAWLAYGLGNIGAGDMGLPAMFTSWIYVFLLVTSTVIGFYFVARKVDTSYQGNPNKILSAVLLVVLLVMFYTQLVSIAAGTVQNPALCSLNIELNDANNLNGPFLFRKGTKDICIWQVAVSAANVSYCNQITDIYTDGAVNSRKNFCVRDIAMKLKDIKLCDLIINNRDATDNCIFGVQFVTGTLPKR